MRYNLTETHIAGIAAAVLAIVIIVVAVGLMSVAQPSDTEGNGTLSPTVGDITEQTSPETHTPGFTPAPTVTSEQTPTSTTEPPSTEPPPKDNEGVDPNKISVTPMCTDSKSGEAWYELSNKNAETATLSFSSTAGGTSDSIAVQGGGGSAEISIPATNGAALVVEFPGIDNGQHSGTSYQPASKACNGGTDGGTDNGTDGGTDNGTDGGTDNGTDGGTGLTPAVTLSDQTPSDDQTVTIDEASLPNGGFVVLSTEDNPRVAASQKLDSGTKKDVTVSLPQKIDEEKTFTAAIYNDTNGNSQLDENDMPYTNQGSVVSDTATVTPGSEEGDGGWFRLD
ncbi:DUF7282 domain-containing protein [Halocatena salina]|uniref:DUF7282 domain-containing protein n=1 Tax=Halocatena salina TaxID=2934340 RepID=A0A8U0A480_9EURY|nr:hypothetical protein [Halocatena salina]UPM44011.1 hypothetical protein MW046_06095 [Halocatena salina]